MLNKILNAHFPLPAQRQVKAHASLPILPIIQTPSTEYSESSFLCGYSIPFSIQVLWNCNSAWHLHDNVHLASLPKTVSRVLHSNACQYTYILETFCSELLLLLFGQHQTCFHRKSIEMFRAHRVKLGSTLLGTFISR